MTKVMTEIMNGETYQYYPLGKPVVHAVGVCGGRPTFKYTRIEIAGTLDRLAASESLDEMGAGYRGRVSRQAIIEAIQIVTAGFLETLPTLSQPNAGAGRTVLTFPLDDRGQPSGGLLAEAP
jgi:uncharacterized protein (DUF433 family)